MCGIETIVNIQGQSTEILRLVVDLAGGLRPWVRSHEPMWEQHEMFIDHDDKEAKRGSRPRWAVTGEAWKEVCVDL